MEGAVPLLFAAALIPTLLGVAGLLLLRTRRRLGIVLLSAMLLTLGLMAMFAMG